MKRQLNILLIITIWLVSCAPTEDEKAASLVQSIDSLYAQGKYADALDSIESLRRTYPMAIESRKHALTVWQNASLKLAQSDIAITDSALQATIAIIQASTSIGERNRLGVRRDSLKARYEAMCGVVRMIRMRQKEGK
uniref:Tetratricopeptide repeat protein n=1 Tax=Prevotella sp. GTC17254 TaxID=3236794 RepID=A0AB33J3U9_9BACT